MANLMRRLAASSVVALAFSPLAQAEERVPDRAALKKYYNPLTEAFVSASGQPVARLRAGAFAYNFERLLRGDPLDENAKVKTAPNGTQMLIYPKENSTNMLVVYAVVPPKGYEGTLPTSVCLQQNNAVIKAWTISPNGDLAERSTAANPPGGNIAACNATVNLAYREISQQVAEAEAKKSGQTAGLSAAPVVANSNNGSPRPALQ